MVDLGVSHALAIRWWAGLESSPAMGGLDVRGGAHVCLVVASLGDWLGLKAGHGSGFSERRDKVLRGVPQRRALRGAQVTHPQRDRGISPTTFCWSKQPLASPDSRRGVSIARWWEEQPTGTERADDTITGDHPPQP